MEEALQLICEARRIPAVKVEPSLITLIILHLPLASRLRLLAVSASSLPSASVAGYSSCERSSVLEAPSRIEELDFDHEAGDVTARATNMCYSCV